MKELEGSTLDAALIASAQKVEHYEIATYGTLATFAEVLEMQPRRFFRQSMLITLLNPKAIVFYMAFFPLFVDPARHQAVSGRFTPICQVLMARPTWR